MGGKGFRGGEGRTAFDGNIVLPGLEGLGGERHSEAGNGPVRAKLEGL